MSRTQRDSEETDRHPDVLLVGPGGQSISDRGGSALLPTGEEVVAASTSETSER